MTMRRYAKFRKGHVGNWVLLGKIWTKHANCYICNKELRGEQLIYTHLQTKENIAVCQYCVREFESYPTTNTKVNPRGGFRTYLVKGRELELKDAFNGMSFESRKESRDIFQKLYTKGVVVVPSTDIIGHELVMWLEKKGIVKIVKNK